MRRVFFAAGLLLAGCYSTIPGDVTGNHRPFDFEHPGCAASVTEPPAGTVDVRYLGSGGVYIGWGPDAILVGPFFSNPSLAQSLFCSMRHDRERIHNHLALANVPTGNVRAILTGHSHYDHIGDVPVVAQEYATGARIYVNQVGVRMLAAYPLLRDRIHAVNENDVIGVAGANGAEVIRIHAIKSDHAPQVCPSRRWPCDVSNCPLDVAWDTPFESHLLRDFCGGQTLAYVIDLLRDGRVRYRIYYNDAAPEAPLGVPILNDKVPYDMAILCMASYDFVHGYPEEVLKAIHPVHVVIAHYEDFFEKTEGHWRFVTLLTTRKARRFIERMRAANAGESTPPSTKPICGATAPDFTVPVVGEQMLYTPVR